MEDQRQKIISSVFSRRNANGALEETYVSHVKIWEDAGPEGGGRKPRYILLSQASNGAGFIHKSKMNANGTFSVGKTWRLAELRAVQVANPLAFNITLSRTYRWQTENQVDQLNFLEALIRLFRTITNGAASLKIEGVEDPQLAAEGTINARNDFIRAARTPSPTSLTGSRNLRPRTPSQPDRDRELAEPIPSPGASSSMRNDIPSRAASPANLSRSRDTTKNRPPSITVPVHAGAIQSSTPRRPSNAAYTSNASTNPQGSLLRTIPTNVNISRDNSQSTESNLSKDWSQRDVLLSPLPPRDTSPVLGNRTRKLSARSVNAPVIADSPSTRREQNTRISFYDTPNQAMLDRLLTGTTGDDQVDVEGEEADAQATLGSVEEMIEGYEWVSEDVIGRKTTRDAVELIEARLLDELTALDKANIHSFLESDDRISLVMKFMDDAISELDNMDSLVSSYKIHLNAVNDDILFVQSQNRGLQVQTQNQRALLGELQNLLRTVHVDQEALIILTQESLEKAQSIQRLEEAASELYKALQAGRQTDMAATMERLQEYRTHNSQFCKRIFDFLSIMFTAQSKLLLGETNGIAKAPRGRPAVIPHQEIEAYLGRYAGLMLYLKEMDESIYGRLCAAYFSTASQLHHAQIKGLLSAYINFIKRPPDEDQEQSFSANFSNTVSKGVTGMRRAGTIIRSPMEGRNKDKDKNLDGDLRASEVFELILEQIFPLVCQEYEFITDFLQINDAALTFADYMGLDSYFRRQASRAAGLNQSTLKLVRGAMDLIFGFLTGELKAWMDNALLKDGIEIIGMFAILERFQAEAEERNNEFLVSMFGKQHSRLKGIFDRHVNDQLKGIEQTKLTSKKRKGVAHFIKYFPIYVARVENQLIDADGLEIRASVDDAYEKIVQAMFDSLKQMAKLEGEGEDKGQLNYHVILIENMHYFVAEMSKMDLRSILTFSKLAENLYEENIAAYVKIIFRRPFGKLIDYFDGVDQLLKSTGPNEISSSAAYSKSALKKVVKEYTSKDIKKHVDVLFRRVEKHFTEASEKATEEGVGIIPGTVVVGVWKSCDEELQRLTDRFSTLISQCYGNAGVSLEYTKADVQAAFRKHRVSS